MTITIERHGSRADHGMYYISLEGIRIGWRGENMVIAADKVADFASKADHNYEVIVPLAVVREIAKQYFHRPERT